MENLNKKIILAIQNDPTDPPHLAGRWLMELGFEIRILRAYSGEDVPLTVPNDICALMPLGGHMNALDDENYPFLIRERALLADAVARDIPIFAICLGTQLLAAALDGEVTKAAKGEIGIYKVNQITSDEIFDLAPESLVAQWHEDIVSKLPSMATLIASSERCENQIYKLGSNSYGVQFHPEIDASIIHTWEEHADNAFIESGKDSVESEVKIAEDELARTWKPVIQKWGSAVLLLGGHTAVS